MKRLFFYAFGFIIALSSLALYSCDNDDVEPSIRYPNALVTIKTNSSTGQVYFQLDDSTTILPTNIKESTYGKRSCGHLPTLRYKRDRADITQKPRM